MEHSHNTLTPADRQAPWQCQRSPRRRSRGHRRMGFALLVLLALAACAAPPRMQATPTPTPRPTLTATATPPPTATPRPWPTRRPTATATPTPLFPLAYEHVPATPPSAEAVVQRARALACEPPCWFGLEPGVSTLQDLLDLWEPWSKIRWGWNEKKHAFTGHFTNPAFYMAFSADRQGVLTGMKIEPTRRLPEYAPAALMRRLGPPPWFVRLFAWDGPGGEEPIVDTSGLLLFYIGYPSRYVVFEMLDFTEDLGLELPRHFQACIPDPDFSVTYFAYPKSTFAQAEVWLVQEGVKPPGRFLTSKDETLQQILEEQSPFCVEIELEE